MIILILIFCIFKGHNNLKYTNALYEQIDQCDEDDQFCYRNISDNSIRNYLNGLSQLKKDEKLQEQFNGFAMVNLIVKKTEGRGLGLFVGKKTKKGEPFLMINSKKMIGNQDINFGMFYQNSLSLQKYNPRLPREKDFAFIINLLFHFSMIEQSFLQGDLCSIPYDEISPMYSFTDFEFNIFKGFPEVQKIVVQRNIKIKEEFLQFKQGRYICIDVLFQII